MIDEPETSRSLRPRYSRTPSTPKKQQRKRAVSAEKRVSVKSLSKFSSFSDDDENISLENNTSSFKARVKRSPSLDDNDSPWQNGKFKSTLEIVSYYREQIGDCWPNILPKTDFTYDTTSKWYGKEIAPGIPVIPNMARPPLHPIKQAARYSFLSTSSEKLFGSSSINGKSNSDQYATRSTSPDLEERSLFRKCISMLISTFLALLCLPYNLIFRRTVDSDSSDGRNVRREINGGSTWWTAPFRLVYWLMMVIFTWETKILYSVRNFFKKVDSFVTLKLFLLLTIFASVFISLYVYYGFDLKTIQIPTINVTELHNFSAWEFDYSGAIEMLKPLNLSRAYDQYADMVNIGWIYGQ